MKIFSVCYKCGYIYDGELDNNNSWKCPKCKTQFKLWYNPKIDQNEIIITDEDMEVEDDRG